MIKTICDKCGKEITGKVNIETEQIELLGDNGTITLSKELHYCDKCKKDLYCGFKAGDQVITSDGRVGTIMDFCTCGNCKERGFYEPEVLTELGFDQIFITDTDRKLNFNSFYKIGEHIYGNLDKERILYEINEQIEEIEISKKRLFQLRRQRDLVNYYIKKEKSNDKARN